MAGPYTGHNSFLLVGAESTFDTAASSITKDIGYVENANSSFNNNAQDIRSLGDRQSEDTIPGNFDAGLTADGHLNSGAILEMFFGQCTDAATSTDYKHTFLDTAGSPSTLPSSIGSYTIRENLSAGTDITLTHTGCKVNTCEIKLETNNTLKFNSEIVGTNVVKATTAGTRVRTTTKPMGGFQGTISLADTGSSYTVIGLPSTFTISLNNNIDANDVKALGSRLNQELVAKNLESPVKFTQKFANSVEFEQFLGGTTAGDSVTNSDIKIQVTNGTTLGSGRIELYLELTNGMLTTTEVNKAHDGVIEASYEFVNGRIKSCYFVDAVPTYF